MPPSNHGKAPPPPAPAQQSHRPRATIEDTAKSGTQSPGVSDTTRSGTAATAADPNATELPGGQDPRDPQYPGKYSTSENVTTDEQRSAQEANKEDITTADIGPYGTATRAEQVESQKAAAVNPLAPQSTTISEPHTAIGGGLLMPPAPEGFRSPIPTGHPPASQWRFDPMTGQPLTRDEGGHAAGPRSTTASRARARLDDKEDDVEITLSAPVTFTDDNRTEHHYEAGKQSMPRAHAEHWYVRQHEKHEPEETKSK